jgi:hypothetical protein
MSAKSTFYLLDMWLLKYILVVSGRIKARLNSSFVISRNMHKELTAWISDLLARNNDIKITSEEVKERFDREDPTEYGLQIPKWFPDYDYVHALICDILKPYLSCDSLVLDLGGGRGGINGRVFCAIF